MHSSLPGKKTFYATHIICPSIFSYEIHLHASTCASSKLQLCLFFISLFLCNVQFTVFSEKGLLVLSTHPCRCTLYFVIVLCNSNHWPHSSSRMQSVCKNRRLQAALLLTLHFCINRFFVPRFIFGTLSAQMCAYLTPCAIYSLSLQTKRLILAVSGNWIDFALLRLAYNLSACMHCLGNSYWRGHICKQCRVQLARS